MWPNTELCELPEQIVFRYVTEHHYLGEKITVRRGIVDRGAPEAFDLEFAGWQLYDLFGETSLYILVNRQE